MSTDTSAEVREPWTVPLDDPPVPEGWVTGPPDFVGVGAQRCGTTWWYRGAIRTHPGVVREAKPGKELHFFDRFFDGDVPDDLAERYARHFPRPADAITGEWTPRYMHDYWTPHLLHRCAPDARILVMLRDPVERYRSGVVREQRNALERGNEFRLSDIGDAVYRSLYSKQLELLLELYDRERVLVLQYERCRLDPLGEMRRTQSFLGLEPLAEAPKRLVKESAAAPKPELAEDLRQGLVDRLRADVARTAEVCPEIDVALWPNFSHVA